MFFSFFRGFFRVFVWFFLFSVFAHFHAFSRFLRFSCIVMGIGPQKLHGFLGLFVLFHVFGFFRVAVFMFTNSAEIFLGKPCVNKNMKIYNFSSN